MNSTAHAHSQSGEIDQLRQKLKQYNDYDEIKRELEIMKVWNPLIISIMVYRRSLRSMSSSPDWRRKMTLRVPA